MHLAVLVENIEIIRILLQNRSINKNINDHIIIYNIWNLQILFYDFSIFLWKTPYEYAENEEIKQLFIEFDK